MESKQPERDEYGRIVEESSITEDQYNALFEDDSEGPDNAEADNESDEQSSDTEPNTVMAEPTIVTKVDSPPVIRKPILTIFAEPPKPQPVQKAPIKIDLDKEMATIKYADGINPVSLPVIKQARAEGRAPPAVEIVEDDEPTCTTQPMSANAIKRLESREATKHNRQLDIQEDYYFAPKVDFAELAPPESTDDLSFVKKNQLKRSESFNNEQSLVVLPERPTLLQRRQAEMQNFSRLEQRITSIPKDNKKKIKKYQDLMEESYRKIQIYVRGDDPDAKINLGKDLDHLLNDKHISRQKFTDTNQQLDPTCIFVEMQDDINEICIYSIKNAWQDCNRHFGNKQENCFRDQNVFQIVSTLGPQKIGILFNAQQKNYYNELEILKEYIKAYALEKPFNMDIDINDMIVANGEYISLLIITSHYVKNYETKAMFVQGLYEYMRSRSSVSGRLLVNAQKHPTIADAELFPLMIKRNMTVKDITRVEETDGRIPSINFIAGAKEINFTVNNNNKNKIKIDNSTNTNSNNTVNVQGDVNGSNIACGGTVSDLISDLKQTKLNGADRYNEFFQNIDIDNPMWCVKGTEILFSDLKTYYEKIGGKASLNNFAKMLVDSGKFQKSPKHPYVGGKRVTIYIRM
jgi:hypothetical protein